MSRVQDLLADLRANAAGAAKQEAKIAELVTSIGKNQRSLKARKRRLWLDAEGKELHPAIDGKNDATRTAQHEAIVAADTQAAAIRGFLDAEEATLNVARAILSGTKREIAVIETELATIRAELNARAAEAFGKMATTNGGAALGVTVQ